MKSPGTAPWLGRPEPPGREPTGRSLTPFWKSGPVREIGSRARTDHLPLVPDAIIFAATGTERGITKVLLIQYSSTGNGFGALTRKANFSLRSLLPVEPFVAHCSGRIFSGLISLRSGNLTSGKFPPLLAFRKKCPFSRIHDISPTDLPFSMHIPPPTPDKH